MAAARRIYLIPSFHYDVAYLRTYAEYLPDCFRILDKALELLAQYPDYCFTVEQVILLEEYWNRFPQKQALIRRAVMEGRLSFAPGMYVMPDMNIPDGESMIMQAQVGRGWIKEHLGVEPRACWIADCWGHHAQLPQILRQCGYEGYFFWRCMREDVKKNDFLWRGIDGTSIQTHWLARGYANLRFPTSAAAVNALELSFAGCRPQDIQNLVDELNSYGPSDTLLVCNGGDMAFPQEAAPGVVEKLNELKELPPMRFSTPAMFLHAVRQEQLSEVAGEFNGSLQGTYTTNIRVKQQNRQLAARLITVESLAAVAGKRADLVNAWKLVLKQQFHDIICGTVTDRALEECDAEHAAAAKEIDRVTQELSEGGVGWFNPLPWGRTELVYAGGKTCIVEVPGLGSVAEPAARPLTSTLPAALPMHWENDHLRVAIDARGYVTSIVDRSSGSELVNSAHRSPFGALSLQMDFGDSWLNFEGPLDGGCFASSMTRNDPDPWDRRQPGTLANASTFLPQVENAQVLLSSGDALIIRQTGAVRFWSAGADFETTITFRRGSARIDYRTVLRPIGKNFRIRVAYPSAIAAGRRFDEIAMGIQPDRIGEHVVQNWIAWCNDSAGMALLNRGTPGANVHDGVLMQTLFRSVAMEYKTQSVLSYNSGVTHCFEYSIMPAAGHSLANVVRAGQELNRPLLEASLPGAVAGIAVDSGEVILSRMVRQADGSMLVRFYEPVGQPTILIISLDKQWKSVNETDAVQERIVRKVALVAGRICVPMKPFEIKTLVLRPV